jgi:hypothetical protein
MRLANRRHEKVEDRESMKVQVRVEADKQLPLHYTVNMIYPASELGHYQVYPNKMVS